MKPKPLIIHSIYEPYPQPTTDELNQEPTRYVGFNDFFWKIHLNHWLSLVQVKLWPDLTVALETKLLEMITPAEVSPLYEQSQVAAVGVKAIRTTNFTVASGIYTAVPMTAHEGIVTTGIHDLVTNPTRFTATIEGWYDFAAGLGFVANATGIRVIRMVKNGATVLSYHVHPAISGVQALVTDIVPVYLVAGDYCEVFALQTSGISLAIEGSNAGMCWASLFLRGTEPL